jgi:hypothetical protein
MPTASHCERHIVLPRKLYGGYDVGRAGARGYNGWSFVD